MNIVHITCGIMQGGVGTMLRALMVAQKRAGENPVLVSIPSQEAIFKKWCNENKLQIPFYAIERYRTQKMTVWGALSRRTYKKLARAYGEENLIFHFHNPLTCGLFGYIPPGSICTIHGFLGQITNKKISNAISTLTFKRLLRKKVRLVGCCQAVADYLNKLYRTTQCVGVLNGMGKTSPQPSSYIKQNGKVHIGYVAYLDELKGWKILAQAYEKLSPAARQRCELTFAGGIFPPEKSDFERFVHQWPDVSYAGYLQDARQTFTPYLDILVLPSRCEGLPMTLLEAMQQGVVPVFTAVGGIAEIIEDGKSGYLIERDSTQLARLLEQLITHPQQVAQVKERVRKRFFEVGTAERMAEKYRQIYQHVLSE